MTTPTNCLECGEELWSVFEAHGFCVRCQRRDREEALETYETDMAIEEAFERKEPVDHVPGERPTSEYSELAIAVARADGRLRVDGDGMGWISGMAPDKATGVKP